MKSLSTQESLHLLKRRVHKTTHNRESHLKSILLDSVTVEEVRAFVQDSGGGDENQKKEVIPMMANLRNGLWYARNFDGNCYFKSTDGHTNVWQFSLTRLNLNVVSAACKHGGALLVDSTRTGKRFPDSFTATVPIWCAIINAVMALLEKEKQKLEEKGLRSSLSKGDNLQELREGEGGEDINNLFQFHPPPWMPAQSAHRILAHQLPKLLKTVSPSVRRLIRAATKFAQLGHTDTDIDTGGGAGGEEGNTNTNTSASTSWKPFVPVFVSPNPDGSMEWESESAHTHSHSHAELLLQAISTGPPGPSGPEEKGVEGEEGEKGVEVVERGEGEKGVESGGGHNNKSALRELPFVPIILLSCSGDRTSAGGGELPSSACGFGSDQLVLDTLTSRNSWTYIQGAGDDEEHWAEGLTPHVFWGNQSVSGGEEGEEGEVGELQSRGIGIVGGEERERDYAVRGTSVRMRVVGDDWRWEEDGILAEKEESSFVCVNMNIQRTGTASASKEYGDGEIEEGK